MGIMTTVVPSLFPIWMLVGGWLAVRLYLRRSFAGAISYSDGAKLGAVTGLLGFAFFSVIVSALIAFETFVLHKGAQFRELMRSTVEQAAARNPDPNVERMMQWLQTPQGLALLVIFTMLVFLVAYLLLSTLGGVMGASLSRKRRS